MTDRTGLEEHTREDYGRIEHELQYAEQLLKSLHRKADRIKSARRTNSVLYAFFVCLLLKVGVQFIAAILVIGVVTTEVLYRRPGGEFVTATWRTGP